MMIPLPDEPLALIEFTPSSPEGGFWVRVVRFEDISPLPIQSCHFAHGFG